MPYLISSHPGCTLEDAVQLAEWLNKEGHMPEQVQDFYPTPGTLATCMWYTGIDPRTMKPVFVPKTPHDKALQRALMQWRKPQNRKLVLEALHKTGREDLIGYSKHCLVKPDKWAAGQAPDQERPAGKRPSARRDKPQEAKKGRSAGKKAPEKPASPRPARKAGWAKAKPKANARKRKEDTKGPLPPDLPAAAALFSRSISGSSERSAGPRLLRPARRDTLL